jgi:hypothetical protein
MPSRSRPTATTICPLQPVGPFWVLDYVSKYSRRKDYDDNTRKYEHDLKVPYYMLFDSDQQKLSLYRHNGEKYVSVMPDVHERCTIPELDVAVGLLNGWVRYWYQGEMLLLPAELQAAVYEANRRADDAVRRTDAAKGRGDAAKSRAGAAEREIAQLRAQLERMRCTAKEGA